ncbi:MAG: hypothetical protein JWN85_2994 [Gammaproteobacteria bacterium]|nr:hypothetical protein [Gammaproteobacteria bacterium]
MNFDRGLPATLPNESRGLTIGGRPAGTAA